MTLLYGPKLSDDMQRAIEERKEEKAKSTWVKGVVVFSNDVRALIL